MIGLKEIIMAASRGRGESYRFTTNVRHECRGTCNMGSGVAADSDALLTDDSGPSVWPFNQKNHHNTPVDHGVLVRFLPFLLVMCGWGLKVQAESSAL